MPRPRVPLRRALLVLLAVLISSGAAVPAFGADARDPRCEDWEAASASPPGIDLRAACPPRAVRTDDVSLDREPLLPYVVGLVVMAGVLGVVGLIAMRVTAPRPSPRRRATGWWACPSCGERNRPDRASCFACQASRADAGAGPSGHDAVNASLGPDAAGTLPPRGATARDAMAREAAPHDPATTDVGSVGTALATRDSHPV
jgi:hypothetical protein